MKAEIAKRLRIRPASDSATDANFDLGIVVLGWERRSSFVASKMLERTTRLVALMYDTSDLAAPENRKWAESNGVQILELNSTSGLIDYRFDRNAVFQVALNSIVAELSATGKELRVFVDASSADRSLFARILNALLDSLPSQFTLRFFYAAAKFKEPAKEYVPIRDCAPCIPELTGRLGGNDSYSILLLGLGFEYGVSLDIMQRIQPDETAVFVPTGGDPRFESAIEKANFGFNFGPDPVKVIKYDVFQPLATFDLLNRIVSGFDSETRITVAPNGPKIISALAVMIGLIKHPAITVYRTSQYVVPKKHLDADGRVTAVDFICA